MSTVAQENDFGRDFLPNIVQWIGQNLDPEDVFDADTLKEALGRNFSPGEIFSEDELSNWAYDHGMVEEE